MTHAILIFGGSSDERLVSVASAQNLVGQFSFSQLWFMHPSGAVSQVSKAELHDHARPFEIAFEPQAVPFCQHLEQTLPTLKDQAVFLGLHGAEGEDGTLQSLFETARVPFTGSGSKSSRECFNKAVTKKIVEEVGIAVAPQMLLARSDAPLLTRQLTDFFEQHGMLVVKPVASGSSFGLHIVERANQIPHVADEIAKSVYAGFLVEQFLVGRELTVGVIERNGTVQALCPSEVKMQVGRSFDYEGKYLGKGSTEVTPAEISAEAQSTAQDMAIKAHRALGCFGYSRTDMILTQTGPVFLETNTLPGLSKASFIPQQLKVAGISLRDFVQEQLDAAGAR